MALTAGEVNDRLFSQKENHMPKGRSPNYPSLPLADAIEKVRLIYSGIHTHAAPKDVIAESLGYTSLSGRPLSYIGTLRRYDLLKTAGSGNLQVTDNAIAILELPPGSPERKKAMSDAAFSPSLFTELRAEFPDKLPNDSTLRHYLVKKGFMSKAADEIIHVVRANLELLEEEASEYNPAMSSTEPQHSVAAAERKRILDRALVSKTAADLAVLGVPVPDDGKELRFNISRDSEAQVIFRGPVTQEAIDKLAKLLELQKDTFPTEAELQVAEKQEGGE
jgi:hypothetical protein